MKKIFKFLVLSFFAASVTTFLGCKKDEIATLYTRTISSITATNAVTGITETNAVTGGVVISSGGVDIIARGVCWSTGHDPTVSDNLTTDGTGSGTFTSIITSLTPNTTFYIRAYATNSAGTAYGNEVTFTTPLTSFPGAARFGAASFSIGTKVYIGLGLDFKYDNDPEGETSYYKDFWEWDQAINVWTRKADYPGNSEGGVVWFSIGTKGYIGSSISGNVTELWVYDPATDAWTQKASLLTTGMEYYSLLGFSIGNKGYIGGVGVTDSINDGSHYYYKNIFWEYDQATNTWTQKANFGGNARSGAVGFSIGNKGYIGTGTVDGDNNLKDFWEWDQASDVWTKKADLGGSARSGAVAFSIGNKGYLGTGDERGGKLLKDFWEWDQATDVWTRKADLGGNARSGAAGFSIGNKGYIGTGYVYGKGVRDFWEYDPTIK